MADLICCKCPVYPPGRDPQVLNVKLILFLSTLPFARCSSALGSHLKILLQKNTAMFSQLLHLLTKTMYLSLAPCYWHFWYPCSCIFKQLVHNLYSEAFQFGHWPENPLLWADFPQSLRANNRVLWPIRMDGRKGNMQPIRYERKVGNII
jgi:hypothetical protein